MAVTLITTLSTLLLFMLIIFQLPLLADSRQVCSVPMRVKNTKMNLFSGNYEVNSHLRYICEEGYKRQAGTSNLAICQFNDKTKKANWKYGNISCIRDPLIPTTTPSITKSPFITSVSISSHVSTSSFMTAERFTTMLLTPTVKIHEIRHTTEEKLTGTTQIPGRTTVVRLSTIHHSAPGRTHSPGLQLDTQTLLPKETVKAITEQTTVSTYTTATVTENSGYTATVKQSTDTNFRTPEQNTDLTNLQTSTWKKTERITIAVGTLVAIVLLVGVIILVVYCRKRSTKTSPRYSEGTQIHLQNNNPKDDSPASNTSHEESEEESFL